MPGGVSFGLSLFGTGLALTIIVVDPIKPVHLMTLALASVTIALGVAGGAVASDGSAITTSAGTAVVTPTGSRESGSPWRAESSRRPTRWTR
jgi:hypothetical protein